MKNFKLDPLTNDVEIKNNQIQLVQDSELLKQTCRTVLGTNNGEWFNDEKEGISFQNIFSKPINYELIENEIQSGLIQVDESLKIETFEHELNDRGLKVKFKARNEAGDVVNTEISYE